MQITLDVNKVYMKSSAIDVLLNNLAVAEVGTVL